MKKLFAKLEVRTWHIPVMLFLLTAMAYAPFIQSLGFYWDDWPVINLIQNRSDFWAYYAYDRPFSAWTFILTAPLFGISPLKWHLFTLFMRYLTIVGVWWIVRQLWPKFTLQTTWMAILFAVYPAFTLQPIAVAFSQHWITYSLFALSVGCMLAAQRQPHHFRLYTVLALLTQALHALTMEYLWGLELIRPFFLWLVIASAGNQKASLSYVIKHTLPYYGVLGVLLIWRAFFLEIPGGDPNAFVLLQLIREDPLTGLQSGLTIALRDLVYLLFTTWTDTLTPDLWDFSDRFMVAAWGWVFVVGGLAFVFLWRQISSTSIETRETSFHKQAISLGFLAVIISLIPTWTTDNQMTVGLYASRFSLAASFGAGILLVGIVDYFFRETWQKVLVIALFAGLAAGTHLRNTNNFRWDWVKQQQFFWQLAWRVPGLENHTPIFSDGAIFRYAGSYSTSSALNTLYPAQVSYPEQSYWFVELDRGLHHEMESFENGLPVENTFRNLTFSSTTQDGIVILFEPEVSPCFWVLLPDTYLNPDLPELTAEAVPASNLARIQTTQTYSLETFHTVFGDEYPHTWCYYYQKAELSRQTEDWDEISRLGKEAVQLDYKPINPVEWFPFIEAYARLGNWEEAEALMLSAFRFVQMTRARPAYCAFWQSLPPAPSTRIYEELGCDLLID